MKKILLLQLLIAAFVAALLIDTNEYKTVEIVKVAQPGDTLWYIADGMMDRQDKYKDVREMIYYIEKRNKQDGKCLSPLTPGTEIVIPLMIKK